MTRKHQKSKNCKTCPWVNSGFSGNYFPPETLQKTIVHDINAGVVQSCHADHHATFCAGALAFQKRNRTLHENRAASYGIEHGILSESMIDTSIETFDTIEEMLEYHQIRQDVNQLFS